MRILKVDPELISILKRLQHFNKHSHLQLFFFFFFLKDEVMLELGVGCADWLSPRSEAPWS